VPVVAHDLSARGAGANARDALILFCSHQITLTQNAEKENDLSFELVHFWHKCKRCGPLLEAKHEF
jgi:hypothetical protein